MIRSIVMPQQPIMSARIGHIGQPPSWNASARSLSADIQLSLVELRESRGKRPRGATPSQGPGQGFKSSRILPSGAILAISPHCGSPLSGTPFGAESYVPARQIAVAAPLLYVRLAWERIRA